MWINNFINELKAWHVVRSVYRKNRKDFEKIGLKSDYFGRLYKVINRDPEITLGSDEDAVFLQNELSVITQFLIRLNLIDILAYELRPLENETDLGNGTIEYEHAYLIIFTPAWNLDKQYVTFKSVFGLLISIILIIFCITCLISKIKW